MAIADGREIETAAAQANVASATQEENAVTMEAVEDREVHFVLISMELGNIAAEVSFGSTQELVAETVDETASGILAVMRPRETDGPGENLLVRYDSAPPEWHAGEEINVHVNNFEATNAQVRVLIGYVPVGEVSRDRLRAQA